MMRRSVTVTASIHGTFPASLSTNDVHVVRFSLDSDIDMTALRPMLDDHERHREMKFALASDRRRFLVAHALTRSILGRYLQVSPERIRFTFDPHGKPHLTDAGLDLRFNLSHAGERALLALSISREVGVDIEKERPVAALDLAHRYFSPIEYRRLASLPPDQVVSAFFRCWTRKESFLKASGEGLAGLTNEFTVSMDDTACPVLFTAPGTAPDKWTIVPVPVERGYAAALTAAGTSWRLTRSDVLLRMG
jgi:4'-phosphopantetheinyl transferase